jgi:hypothetical protein
MSGENTAKTTPEVGDEIEDGTIYAGISPDTHQPMYAAPKDASLTFTFNAAKKYAADLNALDALGHNDWRVPTKAELNVLWENRNKGKLAGTFNETGSPTAGWYWSSSRADIILGWAQRFSNGSRCGNDEYVASSLRCVR